MDSSPDLVSVPTGVGTIAVMMMSNVEGPEQGEGVGRTSHDAEIRKLRATVKNNS